MYTEKKEFLQTICEYIDKLIKGLLDVSQLIHEGSEMEASKNMINVFEGIDYIIKAVTLIDEMQEAKNHIEELNEQLSAIIEAFENEDYVLIGDLFEYELVPVVQNLKKEFENIMEQNYTN